MARAFAINTLEEKEAKKSRVPADGITHKFAATLLIVSYVLLRREEKGRNKKRRFRFSLQIRLGERNDPRFADWNFNRGPIISDAEKRARAITTDKERDKKRCRLIGGHDHHKENQS